jgi:AraC family transcriptional regulator
MQVMRQEEPGLDGPLAPLDLHKIAPFEAAAASDRLGWVSLEAVRYRQAPAFEFNLPAITHHRLVLYTRPSEELDLLYEGVKRHVPPPAGAVSLVPAGSPHRVRSSGCKDELHVYLEPGLVGRVAAEAFGLDPARLTVPPLDALDLPHLRAALAAVGAEMTAGGAGGRLAAEALANVLAVHLLRHVLAPRRPKRGRDGMLPRGRLRAVVEYVEDHLDTGPSLGQLAAVARLSAYHFARQFKAATGLPPHQYLIARRVERAKHFLQAGTDLSLAEVAASAGFSDQSQFSRHFKRLVGVTPGQFRTPARIAEPAASPAKKRQSDPLTIPHEQGGPARAPPMARADGAAPPCPQGEDSLRQGRGFE